jgi:hypothetical protein
MLLIVVPALQLVVLRKTHDPLTDPPSDQPGEPEGG